MEAPLTEVGPVDFEIYQRRAQDTNLLAGKDPDVRLLAPMLGLATATGGLLDIRKKVLTDAIDEQSGRDLFKQELGDLLWYVAAVATADGFDLEEIAAENLERTKNLWDDLGQPQDLKTLPVFDEGFPQEERFPRRLVIEFQEERDDQDREVARLILRDAEPNAFPDGPISRGLDALGIEKFTGFRVGEDIGARLNDNTRRVNGYRFHDAIHLGFLACLGWSATFRSVLRVKRGSDSDTDNAEDGARAIFSEEGLAATLSRLAKRRMGYRGVFNVDGETIEVIEACVEGLEVEEIPVWAWRKAVISGFDAMHQLHANHGGILTVDLDERKLAFEPLA